MTKVALTIVVILTLLSCSENTAPKEVKTYQVVNPLIIDTTYEREYATTISSIQNVEIRNKVRGFIEEIHVDEGQKVFTGQILFSLNNRELEQLVRKAEASVQIAEAELKGIEIEYENTKKLFDKNIVAKSELGIPYKKGSLVDEGSLLTSISNNEFIYAYYNVSEIDYLEFVQSKNKRSNKVKLVLADNSVYPESGLIETTESEFDASTGNIAFRAKFPNEDRILKQGSSGKILAPSHFKNAILVPQKSSFEVQGNIYVYVVDAQNKVAIRKINPVIRLSNFYVLEDGLKATDKIILEGIQTVKEGDIIKAQIIPMPTFS